MAKNPSMLPPKPLVPLQRKKIYSRSISPKALSSLVNTLSVPSGPTFQAYRPA